MMFPFFCYVKKQSNCWWCDTSWRPWHLCYDLNWTHKYVCFLTVAGDQAAIEAVLWPVGADPGAGPTLVPHHRPLDAAQRQADSRPAVPAAARLHRYRRGHRRVLWGLQRGCGETQPHTICRAVKSPRFFFSRKVLVWPLDTVLLLYEGFIYQSLCDMLEVYLSIYDL